MHEECRIEQVDEGKPNMSKKTGGAKFSYGAAALLLTSLFFMPAHAQVGDSPSLGDGMPSSLAAVSGGMAAGSSDETPALLSGAPTTLTNAVPATEGVRTGAAAQPNAPMRKETAGKNEYSEFQEFVANSVGRILPIYGHDLFDVPPSTFAPLDTVPVTADYVIGPGDEIVIRGWGQVDIDMDVVVDRNGAIVLPKVGSINVAGIRYQELQGHLKQAISRVFRNFELNVALGKLRSIQVFVVGQARRPGAYTVSSLSTLVNTLFASGGPSAQGSLRHIQVKRGGKVVSELDLYDFLLKGDKSKDIPLLPGDVIYIPPVGQLAAIDGSVNNPAIYELRKEANTLSDLIDMAGGLTTTAEGDKVRVERIDGRRMRKVEEFGLDKAGLGHLLKDGDLVRVQAISGQFGNAVTLRGNVASPGRYPWKEGMRVSDLIPDVDALIAPEYWTRQNLIHKTDITDEKRLQTEIKRNQNEINWDYALVERLDKNTLTTSLIPFNLGLAIGGKDEANNIRLQPGDVITIFSKDDIQVPIAKRSVYVRLEGEFNHAGVYKALPGETLRQLVARVGGLTPNAYLFGAALNRESVRAMQQKKLDKMVDRMAEDIERNLAVRSQAALSKEDVESAKAQAEGQRALLERMRQAKAGGRIVLDMTPEAEMKDLPDIALVDGDQFIVPTRPSTVSVMGMIYNENAFMYKPGKRVSDYLDHAGGPTRDADEGRIYVVRADGSVASGQGGGSFFGGFGGEVVLPGDTVVVPERLERFSLTKELKDWAQIFYQFALGVGGIKMLRL
jgi:protein involved in polysaccharide export with SLBB domain